ncbi:MAG: alpha-amylase family glycosyl hydrolase [Chitinophagales bacterium]
MKKTIAFVLMAGMLFNEASSQDFMFQGFYWNFPYLLGIKRWGQDFNNKIPELNKAGFTAVWLPPLSRSSSDQASVGYDVQDYYDLGEYGLGATRFGTRKDVNDVLNNLKSRGMIPVADIIYNHRAGGKPEINTAVEGWIENYNSAKVNAGDQPFPSDRFRNYLLLSDTGNGAGTYYIKIRSASQHSNFFNKPYVLALWTKKVKLANDTLQDTYEVEPNGGGDCGDTSNFCVLGRRKYCHIDAVGCKTDEFRLQLDTSMFYGTGDTLWISMANIGTTLGDFSDHFIYGLWNAAKSVDVQNQLRYETYTDFTHMPSGKGAMDKSNFKPNGNPTQLSGDIDAMYFFYDIDHSVASSQQVLKEYTRWMFDSVGITGMRVDAVKHFPASFMGEALNYLHQNNIHPKIVVGESYDYNPSVLKGWVDNVESNMSAGAKDSIHVRVFDFGLRGALKAACDQFGYDVRGVFSAGVVDGAGGSGSNVVTFINNHDFRDPGQPVEHNPELAYAYILLNNKVGLPCVFYKDFFGNNFMKGRIKGMIAAHRKYIYNSNIVDYLSNGSGYPNFYVHGFANTTLTFQLQNAVTQRPVVVAINFAGDTLDVYQKINMNTLTVGDTFTNIFGVGPDTLLTVNSNNELHIRIPPRSFSMFVKGNLRDSLISISDTLTTGPNGVETTDVPLSIGAVYPNPFGNQLGVAFYETIGTVAHIEIRDLMGAIVLQKQVYESDSPVHVIDTEALPTGIYFAVLKNNGKELRCKVIRR